MAPVQFYQPLTTHFLQYPVGVHHRQSRCVRQFKLRDGKVEAAAADEAYRQQPVIEFAEEVAEPLQRGAAAQIDAPFALDGGGDQGVDPHRPRDFGMARSEEHTSELQSLMRISYAVFCLKKKKSTFVGF